MPLAQLLVDFQPLPLLPTSKVGPSGADSQVDGFLYILGPHGSLQWTLLWGWEFLPVPQPPQIFLVRSSEALFPHAGTLGWVVCLAPHLFFPVYLHANVEIPAPPAPASPAQSSSCCLALSPLYLNCLSRPLLPVWMNVSSLTLWLSNFHTVQFFGKSGYFLFLNLLSFFWLCEEAKCIYLRLHLGWQSLQEFLTHAISDYWVRGTDLFSLKLSNKKMRKANTIVALQCEWIKIYLFFHQISKKYSFWCAAGF